ncbi:hypothetical protein [[Eubacterium] cellulosolvens]
MKLEKASIEPLNLLMGGLLIRLMLAPFTGNPWDIAVWKDIGYRILILHANVYDIPTNGAWAWGYYAYPPGWLIWCAAAYPFSFHPHLYALIIKIPIIAADILLAYLIYNVCRRNDRSEQKSRFACAFFLFNPIIILISSVWGMFDALPALLTLISVILFFQRKVDEGSLALGFAILFKIYPIFLLPVFLLYATRYFEKARMIMLRFTAVSLSIPFLFSLPFLLDNATNYFAAFFRHMQPTGWLSYWFPLSHLSMALSRLSSIIFIILFSGTYSLLIFKKRLMADPSFSMLNRSIIIILLLFYLTSPKMNVQYLVWGLPFMIIETTLFENALSKKSIITLTSFGLLLALCLLPFNNYFILNRIIGFPKAPWTSIIFAVALLISLLFPFVCFKFFQKLVKIKVPLKRKWNLMPGVILILILLGVSFFLAPWPMKRNIDKSMVYVAFPESPATGFSLQSPDLGVDEFLNKYPCEIVVLAFGSDFINTFTDSSQDRVVNRFFKAYYYEEWTEHDIHNLIERLHSRNIQAVLGIYLVNDLIINGRGFTSSWINTYHPEVLDQNTLIFSVPLRDDDSSKAGRRQPYAVYFGDRIINIVERYKFDGVFLSTIGCDALFSIHYVRGLKVLVKYLSPYLNDRQLFLSLGDFDIEIGNSLNEIAPFVDAFVIQTPVWSKGIYLLDMDMNFEKAKEIVQQYRMVLNPDSKLLFTWEIMDEQWGWINSSYFFNREYDELVPLCQGAVLAFANRHSPYQIESRDS